MTRTEQKDSSWLQAPLQAPEGDENRSLRFTRRESLAWPDAAAIFAYLQRYYASQLAWLRESKQDWSYAVADDKTRRQCEQWTVAARATMACLRDIARFMVNAHPEDDRNPLGGPDDY